MPYGTQKPPPGSIPDLQHPHAQGLVALWPFWNGSGTHAEELIHGLHGTLTGFADPPTATSGWGPGQDGVALLFDNSPYIALPLDLTDACEVSGAITIAMSLYVNSLAADQRAFSAWGDNKDQVMVWMDAGGAGDGWAFIYKNIDTDQGVIGEDNDDAVVGQYQQVIATRASNGTMALYVDGLPTATGSRTGAWATNPNDISIGRLADAAQEFDGGMQYMRIYNRAFTVLDAATMFLAPWADFEDDPIAWLRVVEAAGNPWYYYAQQR